MWLKSYYNLNPVWAKKPPPPPWDRVKDSHTSSLFSVLLNENVVDIEKPDG